MSLVVPNRPSYGSLDLRLKKIFWCNIDLCQCPIVVQFFWRMLVGLRPIVLATVPTW